MKVYLSGPIAGADIQLRRQQFEEAERLVVDRLYPDAIVNPMKLHPDCKYMCDPGQLADAPPYIHTWNCWMRTDIKAMMDCDTIVLLPGYDNSPGAKIELMVAQAVGFEIIPISRIS